ncbi:MAG: hypothetical protein M3349_02260 [Actinomycetota bacterium]|nr:hypothetical protein [Actinomycetota bacterium]
MDEPTGSADLGQHWAPVAHQVPDAVPASPGYDPVAAFRGVGDADRSITVTTSAAGVHVEWVTRPHRYGYFSGRPLHPVEIAAVDRVDRRRDQRRWAVLGLLVGLIGLVVWNLNNDPWQPVAALEPGTCFQDSLASVIVRDGVRYPVRGRVEAVDCAAPHQYESIGSVPLRAAGEPSTMAAAAAELCTPLFETYVGADTPGPPPWRLGTFPPYIPFTSDERAHCVVYRESPENPLQPILVEGSAGGGAE